MTTDSLVEIVHETVAPGYGLVRYHGFELIIEMATGYINATKLCAQAGKNRQFFNWIRLQSSKEIIESVASSLHKVRDELTHVIHEGAANEIRGTYVHRDLVPAIAIWASSTYLVKVSRIMEYEATREHRAQLAEKDDAIARLERKLDETKTKLDEAAVESKKQAAEHKAQIAELLGYAKETTTKLDETMFMNTVLNDKMDDVRETLEEVLDTKCVPPPHDETKMHSLRLYAIGDNKYYVTRTQIATQASAHRRVMRKYADAQMVLSLDPIAHSMNTVIRAKEKLKDCMPDAKFSYNVIMCNDADALVALFKSVHDERMKYMPCE